MLNPIICLTITIKSYCYHWIICRLRNYCYHWIICIAISVVRLLAADLLCFDEKNIAVHWKKKSGEKTCLITALGMFSKISSAKISVAFFYLMLPDFGCRPSWHTFNILQECQGKKSCSIKILDTVFGGDPCPGVEKTLSVEARCTSPLSVSFFQEAVSSF